MRLNGMNSPNVERPESPSDAEAPVRVNLRTWMVVVAIKFIYFAQLVAVVGAGFLAVPIAEVFGASEKSVWFSSTLTIATAALNTPVSQAADYWGRKWFLVAPTTCGFAGAILISRAASLGMVIGGFMLLGISFACQSLLFAVVSEVLPRKYRSLAQAMVNVSAGWGAITGLLMGGALVRENDFGRFRTYFYVLAGIYIASTMAIGLCYNPPARELERTLAFSEKLRQLDWWGYLIFSPALTLLCLGLLWSYNPYDWRNVHILSPFLVGVILLVTFLVYEVFFKRDGMLHHELFRHRNFGISLGIVFVEGLVFFTCNYYYPLQISMLNKVGFWSNGLHFSILYFAMLLFSTTVGIYSSRKRVVRSPLLVGTLLLAIFNILMATTSLSSPQAIFWGYPVMAGAGIGVILPIVIVTAQMGTPAHLISTTSGLMITMRSLGASISLAINGAILNSTLSSKLGPTIAAATLPLSLPPTSLAALIDNLASNNMSELQHIPGLTPQILESADYALNEVYNVGFRNIWITAACFTSIAFIASIFLRDPSAEFNNHIDAPATKPTHSHLERITLSNIVKDGQCNGQEPRQ